MIPTTTENVADDRTDLMMQELQDQYDDLMAEETRWLLESGSRLHAIAGNDGHDDDAQEPGVCDMQVEPAEGPGSSDTGT